jgi:hypothetical protein
MGTKCKLFLEVDPAKVCAFVCTVSHACLNILEFLVLQTIMTLSTEELLLPGRPWLGCSSKVHNPEEREFTAAAVWRVKSMETLFGGNRESSTLLLSRAVKPSTWHYLKEQKILSTPRSRHCSTGARQLDGTCAVDMS